MTKVEVLAYHTYEILRCKITCMYT